MVLEKATAGDEDDKDEEITDVSSDSYKVHIDAPEGAEVYLNGNYVGIAPCSFKKTAGAHVVTLRKSGYTTRSYTIQVDSEEKDISFSFTELVPGNGEDVSSGDASED